jgi:sugar lactone lactonase YvrE
MNFANGLDFIGTDLYVADSEGVVYKVNSGGVASVWSQDTSLAPDNTACGGAVPLPIGANGIAHDSSNVYVTNTNHGRLVRIPIDTNGTAGTPVVLIDDCASFVGADGLLIDPADSSFIVALNIQNKLVRVTLNPDAGPTIATIASGPPLYNPASPILDSQGPGGSKRLVVTNPAFFLVGPDAGVRPNVVELPVP